MSTFTRQYSKIQPTGEQGSVDFPESNIEDSFFVNVGADFDEMVCRQQPNARAADGDSKHKST